MIPSGRLVDDERSAAPSRQQALTVSALVSSSRRPLEHAYGDVWVAGELSEWTRWRSGHRYLTLRDNDARLAGVMFRGDAARLPIEPEAGWRVVVRGTVTVFERRGSLQIRVRDLRLEDERGLRQIAIDRLREQLRHEGLLDVHGKRPIPPFPERIGFLTSVHGAALQDVLSVLARRWPCAEVVVYPARVQGLGSENDIARMTRGVSPHRVDVLIVTRGGGSVDDLWPFNTETVVRAIAGCRVPTITAVGHETDFTIADLVSDLRAPTPSAAAEMVAPERA